MAAQPRWLRSLLALLTPTLLLSHIRQEFLLLKSHNQHQHQHQPAKQQQQQQQRGTSYLDGLRGLAALGVFGEHYTDYNLKSFHQWFFTSYYTSSATAPRTSVLQLPYLRLLCGGPMTHIFFVVSGFALALRPMGELHLEEQRGQEQEQNHHRREPAAAAVAGCRCRCRALLASSAIRRPIRLWGPCLALTLPLAVLSRHTGHFRHYIAYEATQLQQFRHWGRDFFGRIAAWPWSSGFSEPPLLPRPRYNVHLWTVPVELAHSYLLFFVVLVLSRLRPRLRVPCLVAVMGAALQGARWTAFEFLAGCLLAVLHLRQNSAAAARRDLASIRGSGSSSSSSSSCCWRFLARIVPTASLLAAGFVASWPTYMSVAPWPYSALAGASYVPSPSSAAATKEPKEEAKFWFALAAAVLVWGAGQSPFCRRFLERPMVQYLGRVSFVFYIVQHPFLNLLQGRLMGAPPRAASVVVDASDGTTTTTTEHEADPGYGLKRWPGVHTGTRLTCTWILGWAVLVPVELLVADYLTRLVDWPCARAARSVEKILCDDAGGCGDVGNGTEKRLQTMSGLHSKGDEDSTDLRFSLPS